MLLPDHEIIKSDMIYPVERSKQDFTDKPSYGPSSYGYDVRLGKKYIPDVYTGKVETAQTETILIQPGQFMLCETMETFHMEPNVTGLVKDKSTYARKGIQAFNTVIEAGWSGVLTLELVNHSSQAVELHVGWGIVQILFDKSEAICDSVYTGKYYKDEGVQVAK